MLRLCDRGAQTIWRTKVFYVRSVVGHGVLTGQRDTCSCWIPDTKFLEYCTMLMKPLEGVVQAVQSVFSEYTLPSGIAKVEVGIEALNDFRWYKALDC
jgi:hypothetical protein